jgi:hypothetical protein
LSKFDIVADLIDFILGEKSPRAKNEKEKRISMGGSVNMPSFGPLVKLIAHCVRSSFTQLMINHPESKVETFTLFKDEKNIDGEKTRLAEKFVLSQEALTLLTCPEFLEIALKNEFACEDLAKALAHVQYGDAPLSKHLCQYLLKSVVNSDYNKISGYLDAVEEIVQVREHTDGKSANL